MDHEKRERRRRRAISGGSMVALADELRLRLEGRELRKEALWVAAALGHVPSQIVLSHVQQFVRGEPSRELLVDLLDGGDLASIGPRGALALTLAAVDVAVDTYVMRWDEVLRWPEPRGHAPARDLGFDPLRSARAVLEGAEGNILAFEAAAVRLVHAEEALGTLAFDDPEVAAKREDLGNIYSAARCLCALARGVLGRDWAQRSAAVWEALRCTLEIHPASAPFLQEVGVRSIPVILEARSATRDAGR